MSYREARTVTCPKCGAQPGDDCTMTNPSRYVWRGGYRINQGDPLLTAHRERREAFQEPSYDIEGEWDDSSYS